MPTKFEIAFENLVSKFPKRYHVKGTQYLQGLLKALAEGDAFISTQVEAVRDNMLVVTASGKHLDRLASNYGVERGRATGIQDDDFRRLIPLLGQSKKQIISTLQEIVDVIYGPYASHANTTCSEPAPYSITNEPFLLVRVDGQDLKIEFHTADAEDPTQATAQEIATAISKRTQGKIIGSVVTNVRTGEQFVNIRTSTVGPQGFIQVTGGDAQTTLRFPEVRPTRQDIATWNVTRYLGSDEMVFTATSGVSPGCKSRGVRRGDFVVIRQDSGFLPENTGSFEVTFVDEDSFRVRNGAGAIESGIVQLHIDDFTFYRANLANILLSSRPATVLSTGEKELTVILPVTSPIVKRNLKGGHHLHGGFSVINSATANTADLGSTTGFPSSGSFKVISSRKNNEGSVSTVSGTDVVLVNADGWPTSGAFYAATTGTFYYYSGKSGKTLQNVSPAPPVSLSGAPVRYAERFSYSGITGNTLTGVFPNPSSAVGLEVAANVELEGPYVGSFLYDKASPFMASNVSTTLAESVQQGSSKTVIEVGDVTDWPDQGEFVLQFSTKEQEGPVRYFGKVGTQALIIDPGHVFERDHLEGSSIRLIRKIGTYSPRKSGIDYAVFLTGTSSARTQLAVYIASVIAAGITVKFQILMPDYKWPVLPLLYAEDPLDVVLASI